MTREINNWIVSVKLSVHQVRRLFPSPWAYAHERPHSEKCGRASIPVNGACSIGSIRVAYPQLMISVPSLTDVTRYPARPYHPRRRVTEFPKRPKENVWSIHILTCVDTPWSILTSLFVRYVHTYMYIHTSTHLISYTRYTLPIESRSNSLRLQWLCLIADGHRLELELLDPWFCWALTSWWTWS